MNANFFGQIAQMNITGDIQITISKGAESNLIVSTILNNEKCGDKAKHLIMPLNLRGTAAELDEEYFERITTPLQTASGLMDNMEAFMKQLEQAQKQSAMEKEKADKERREKEAKEKKYNDAMQKVNDLEKEGKFKEAWMKVPQVVDCPEKADEIRKRKSELSGKFAPDLFGSAGQEEKPEPPNEGLYSKYSADEAEEEIELKDEEENDY